MTGSGECARAATALTHFSLRDRNQSYRGEVFLGDGISSPAALFKRLSQLSHSSIRHCPLRQSNSQRAESSGTSWTIWFRSHCQIPRIGWLLFNFSPDTRLNLQYK